MSKSAKLLMKQDYKKQILILRTHLRARGFYKALESIEYALSLHKGKRKDGQPEFSHQVSQACLFMTLEVYSIFPEETYITIFLHDTAEDYKESVTVKSLFEKYGEIAGESIKVMSKEHSDIIGKLPNDYYYENISNNPIASVCKGLDRIHNLMTMLGAFDSKKQLEYINETINFVLVMLKKSKYKFPQQNSMYENIKFIIQNQIGLYKALNDK